MWSLLGLIVNLLNINLRVIEDMFYFFLLGKEEIRLIEIVTIKRRFFADEFSEDIR